MEARSEGPEQLTPSKLIRGLLARARKVERKRPIRHGRVLQADCLPTVDGPLAATTGLIDLFSS